MKTVNRSVQVGLAGLVLVLWCASASAQDIKYNFMPGTDFSKYKTYKWVRIPKVDYPNQILDNQIMQAIDAQLASKGLAKTESDNADLYVAYQAAVTQEKQFNSYSTDMGGWGYGRWGGWGGYGGGMSTTRTTSSTINIGTLNVDIYDVAAKNQIWRGAATKTLGSGKDPQKVQKNLDKAMAKLFKKYPPPAK
ncbi:MAG TPA: DUF4136 domain-containing protein [Pyrinomonadaceae bacterium]|nr:DUF4136 domain-containing protein [Pyrinomonadaceae bacterium]